VAQGVNQLIQVQNIEMMGLSRSDIIGYASPTLITNLTMALAN
jgi:hypothetical protein